MSSLDPSSYRIYLKNSKYKHILVEGKDDKYLVERLCQDFLINNDQYRENPIRIDSASFIKTDKLVSLPGNNDKVKYIAESIIGMPYAESFIGFMDRDLSKFDWDYECHSELQDKLNAHDVIERLILSRGHSIENYIFDVSILCNTLEISLTTPYVKQAIDQFKGNFESNLRIACSVSLAVSKSQLLQITGSTIDYKLLEIISPTQVVFRFDEWVQKLVTRGISTSQEQNLRSNYIVYSEKVAKASMSLVRWISHGHIGFDFVKALYERCVFDMPPSPQEKNEELSRIAWLKKEKFLYMCINYWIKNTSRNQHDYPLVIFELLGLMP